MPNTTSVNLGQVAAIVAGATPPTNTNLIWLNTSGATAVKMYYDPITQTWIPLTQGMTVAGDNWGTQVVQSDSTLSGQGTTASVLKIAQQSATSGQVLGWNGTTWAPITINTSGLTQVATDATLTGNGTVGSPLGIALQGGVNGQIMGISGGKWGPIAAPAVQFTSGMILLWSGPINAIPSGWFLCNGQNNTPDLTGRFIVGYNPNDPDYSSLIAGPNASSIKTRTLTVNNMPAHAHSVVDPGHSHTLGVRGVVQIVGSGVTNNGITGGGPNQGGSSALNNTGSSMTGITIQPNGSGTPVDIRPSYYVLAYIMKQ